MRLIKAPKANTEKNGLIGLLNSNSGKWTTQNFLVKSIRILHFYTIFLRKSIRILTLTRIIIVYQSEFRLSQLDQKIRPFSTRLFFQ